MNEDREPYVNIVREGRWSYRAVMIMPPIGEYSGDLHWTLNGARRDGRRLLAKEASLRRGPNVIEVVKP